MEQNEFKKDNTIKDVANATKELFLSEYKDECKKIFYDLLIEKCIKEDDMKMLSQQLLKVVSNSINIIKENEDIVFGTIKKCLDRISFLECKVNELEKRLYGDIRKQ